MDKKYRIHCISCGGLVGQHRNNEAAIKCDTCGAEFTLFSDLESENISLVIKRYPGKIITESALDDYAYPAIFCIFCGKGGKTKLIEPKKHYCFQCQNQQCLRKFIPLFDIIQ